MNQKIRVFPDAESIAKEFVQHVETAVAKTVALENLPWRACKVALSGGSTPKRAYELLSKSDLDRTKLELYMVDERYVPPTDERSNEKMIREALAGQDFRFFPMFSPGGVEPAAATYDELLRRNVDKFDIVLLGMGDDGHTASIFPSMWPDEGAGRFCVASKAPVVCEDRITLTMRTICWANETIFMVTGESKAQRVREVIESTFKAKELPDAYNRLPSLYVHRNSINPVWWLDKAAASLLTDH
ncbi:MAG TPA: 6-phosphogluconolactonase [Fimbriimonadaceae bacterium]|nr:6-phosphogluconolactonase [Fimbriimonadaceae bacterium]